MTVPRDGQQKIQRSLPSRSTDFSPYRSVQKDSESRTIFYPLFTEFYIVQSVHYSSVFTVSNRKCNCHL